MPTRKRPSAGGDGAATRPKLQELQYANFPPLEPPFDDDDDSCVCVDSHTINIIISDLKALGFAGAEGFLRAHDPAVVLDVLDQVAPLERYAASNSSRRRRPRKDVRNAPALIRWLVMEASQ